MNRCSNHSARQSISAALPTDNGVILIALLWILTALSVIALSLAQECRIEVMSAKNSQSMETAYYAARAGIMNAIYQLKLKNQLRSQGQQSTTQTAVDSLDLGHLTGSFGGATYQVEFMDEAGKVDLNSVTDPQLRLLIEACGIPQPDSDTIADSILDWKSNANAQAHTNGAKDDFYQGLNPPYHCKNGNFDSVEELLLVRGVTPDYFYGHPERDQDTGDAYYLYGLSRCFSVYRAKNNQVNANFASLPVLLSTGLSIENAQAIISARVTQPFKSLQDLTNAVPGLSSSMTQKLSVQAVKDTTTFTITAAAVADNSKARRVIRAVVNLNQKGQRTPQYKMLYWNENIPDYEGYVQ